MPSNHPREEMWKGYQDVLDNREYNVGDRVNAVVGKAETVRIAVGYFYIGGFDLVKENLQNASKVELLIGTETSQRTIDEIKRGFTDHLNELDKEQSTGGVVKLYELIQDDIVDVKIYDDKVFHPKLYLFNHPLGSIDSGRAIVGSSNLSKSGLSENVELAIETKSAGSVQYLNEWFEGLWKEAEEFDTELMEADIRRSKFGDAVEPKTTPEPPEDDILSPYEATKRFIAKQFEKEVTNETLLEDVTGEYEDQLPAFQQDAFRAAQAPLDKYNGVILSDSVGLGKSYIGSPLIQQYTTAVDHILIITPNRLKSMWRDDLLHEHEGEFPTPARKTFLSFNAVSRLSEKDIQRYRDVDLILIDEAHNFRNQGTQRYDKLQSIGRRDKKFVLLTATPIQNSVRDMENLIKIFADDSDFDINLGGETPSQIFHQYHKLAKIDDRTDQETRDFEQYGEYIDRIFREVAISRDRDYILDNYDDVTIGDTDIKAPKRFPQTITPDDPRIDDLYEEIVDVVLGEDGGEPGLNIPYVSAERYDVDGDNEEEVIVEYQSASVLMLIQLLKRLESSFPAFNESVERLIYRENITRQIAVGDLDDAHKREQVFKQIRKRFRGPLGRDISFDEISDAINNVSDSQREKIINDIDEDTDALRSLQERAEEILESDTGEQNRYAKTERLRTLLTGQADEKVLIFSQYIPTIYHLFNDLTDEDPNHTQIGVFDSFTGEKKVAYVHGSDGYDERIVERFAPEAQNADVTADEEIDVLIASDVLSSGHNLQDARVLVNYDLDWNPMALEQRIGRIDRITTKHDKLRIFNFVPTGELKNRLGLRDKIDTKIESIARTMGHPAPILDSSETQISKSITTYEKVKDLDDLEGQEQLHSSKGSKYDDLKNTVEQFCEQNSISIGELQQALSRAEDSNSTYYFASPESHGDGAVMVLAKITYSTGYEEQKATVFDTESATEVQFGTGGQKTFTEFPRLETDEVAIFTQIASTETRKTRMPDTTRDSLSTFVNALEEPGTWEDRILNTTCDTDQTLRDVKSLCKSALADESSATDEIAEEILELMDEHIVSDYAKKEIGNIYRNRRDYNRAGVLRRVHYLLDEKLDLVKPKTIEEVSVELVGFPHSNQ